MAAPRVTAGDVGPAGTAVRERSPRAVCLAALLAIPAGLLGLLFPLPAAGGALTVLAGLLRPLPGREAVLAAALDLVLVLGWVVPICQLVGAGLLLARQDRWLLFGAGLGGVLGVAWALPVLLQQRDLAWLVVAGIAGAPVAAALLTLAPSVGPWLARVPGSGRAVPVRPPSPVRRFLTWLYLD